MQIITKIKPSGGLARLAVTFALALCAFFVLSLAAPSAHAAAAESYTFDLDYYKSVTFSVDANGQNVVSAELFTGVTAENEIQPYTDVTYAAVTITGSLRTITEVEDVIRVTGGTHAFTLSTVTIEDIGYAPIGISGNGTAATITLVGTNTLTSSASAGIYVADSSTTLTINGTGSLTATGGDAAAGIGAEASNTTSATIIIESGIIAAQGGDDAAGIGSCNSVAGGIVTITGGTVIATGGNGASGVSASTLNANGGVLLAIGGFDASAAINVTTLASTAAGIVIAKTYNDNMDIDQFNGILCTGAGTEASPKTISFYGTQTVDNVLSSMDAVFDTTVKDALDAYLTASESSRTLNIVAPSAVVESGAALAAADGETLMLSSTTTLTSTGTTTVAANGTFGVTDGLTLTAGANLTYGTDFTYASGMFTILSDKAMTLANTDSTTATNHSIKSKVASGSANLTLNGVNISTSTNSAMVMSGMTKLTLTLADGSTNTLESTASGEAGLNVPTMGTTITIQGGDLGTGTLTAKGCENGAGIGGVSNGTGGIINITGGTVYAYGGANAAGIGGGSGSAGGTVTISGGTVYAYGGADAAGIGGGSGQYGSGGTVTISGGVVYAYGGNENAAGIGGGYYGYGSTSQGSFSTGSTSSVTYTSAGSTTTPSIVHLSGGVSEVTFTSGSFATLGGSSSGVSTMQLANSDGTGNAFIVASSIGDTTSQSSWSDTIITLDGGAVYGNSYTLTSDATIPAGYTLTLTAANSSTSTQTLTVASGATLTVDGTLTVVDPQGDTLESYAGGDTVKEAALTAGKVSTGDSSTSSSSSSSDTSTSTDTTDTVTPTSPATSDGGVFAWLVALFRLLAA